MDKLLATVPKNMLAFLAIVGFILLIALVQPPASVCDSQLEIIQHSQRHFLFPDPKSKLVKTTKFEKLRDQCKITNSPGGCYELFQKMKTFLHDLGTMGGECASAVGDVSEYKRAMIETADLMVRLAWGDAPPSAYHAKFGWLDTADISLYCTLKARLISTYGDEFWNGFREKMMKDLPGAQTLPRNQIWDMSIFSENCARYP